MACSSPIRAWFPLAGGSALFHEVADCRAGFVHCRQCAMCRKAKASELATRLEHECFSHSASAWATLTVSDEFRQADGSLSKSIVQRFLKRLRKRVADRCRREGRVPELLRFDAIAEYSPELLRDHYHVFLFGYWPPDAAYWSKSRGGAHQFVSSELTAAWGLGHATFQAVSPGACSYQARHDAWKVTKGTGRHPVPVFDQVGDLVGHREAEFRLASNRPGIGGLFFDVHARQMLALGFCVAGGQKRPIPSYYLARGEVAFPELVSQIRADRQVELERAWEENLPGRLEAREACAAAALARVSRTGVGA